MSFTGRLFLSLALALIAPPAGVALTRGRRIWLVFAVVTPTLGLYRVLIALRVVGPALHDVLAALAVLSWVGAVVVAATSARRPLRTGRAAWVVPLSVALAYLAVTRSLAVGTETLLHRFRVEGVSMTPTLKPGETLLAARGPALRPPIAGDVILYNPPGMPSGVPWLKRVVATEGQTVEVRRGSLWVDGVDRGTDAVRPASVWTVDCENPDAAGVRTEQVGAARYTTLVETQDHATVPDSPPVLVPPGHIWVLGDNRVRSMDSRRHGPVPSSAVRGLLIGVTLPWSRCEGLDAARLGFTGQTP